MDQPEENPDLGISYNAYHQAWCARQPPPAPSTYQQPKPTKVKVADIQAELNNRLLSCKAVGFILRIKLYAGEDQRHLQTMDVTGLSDCSVKLTKKDPLSIVMTDKDTGITRIMCLGLSDSSSSIYLTTELIGHPDTQVKKYMFTKSSNYSF